MTITTLPVSNRFPPVKTNSVSLLLGNGFCRNFDDSKFSWGNISKKAASVYVKVSAPKLNLKQLMSDVGTSNLEDIMLLLDYSILIAQYSGANSTSIDRLKERHQALLHSFVSAVDDAQPSTKKEFNKKPATLKHCVSVLKQFNCIYTLNYDLLLYWAYVDRPKSFGEGFSVPASITQPKTGRVYKATKCELGYDNCRYTWLSTSKHRHDPNIYYLHGAYHLFENGNEIVKVKQQGKFQPSGYVLSVANDLIAGGLQPITVAGGSSGDKVGIINRNHYLKACRQALEDTRGSLVTYGWTCAENDAHILESILKSNLSEIYFGIYCQPKELVGEANTLYYSVIRKAMKKLGLKQHPKLFAFSSRAIDIWSTCGKGLR